MTNLPPPDPRSSRLGFDELIGVVVAFTVIGTILVVSLRNRDRGFNFDSWFPVLIAPQVSSDPTVSPLPTETLPTPTPEVTPQPIAIVSPSVPPVSPVIRATPERVLRTAPVVPVPVVVTSPSPVSAASPTPVKAVNFSDVPDDFWARPYIEALAERNIIVGFKEDNTFRPNQPITRAEFAVLLAKAFEQKAVANVPNFTDVPTKFWAAPAIEEVTRSGFLRGYPNTVFQPNQRIPRVQTVVALTSGLGLVPTAAPNQVLNAYQDAGQIPKYATQSVTAATEQGLVVNYPNPQLLNPNQQATRAEVAAMVYQALVQAGKAEAIPSKYVVKR